jgi:hypothetical protein
MKVMAIRSQVHEDKDDSEHARSMKVMAIRSQVHEDKDDDEHAHE